jgi:hypothetical protein
MRIQKVIHPIGLFNYLRAIIFAKGYKVRRIADGEDEKKE